LANSPEDIHIISYQRDHFVPTSELALPFLDDKGGTMRGYRVFTACRTVRGKVFRMEDHLDRLYHSASGIRMKPPLDRDALGTLLTELVDRNVKSGIQDNLLIDVIFSGGLMGNTMKQSSNGAYLYIAAQPLEVPPNELYESGIALATFPHLRICPDVKLLHYIGAILAHQTVVPTADAYDVLFVDPSDCLTPPLDGKILDSITRRVVLEILKAEGLELREAPIFLNQISSLTESFIASTTRNVLPVTRIDSTIIGSGRPGAVTQSIMGALQAYLDSY
jgi:branched-chain amino acid aminotransferase